MKLLRETIKVHSPGARPSFFDLTGKVGEIIERSEIKEGFCIVYSHHTTCSVMTQECSFDETGSGLEYLQQDLTGIFETIIPTCRKEGQYLHPGPKASEFGAAHGESKAESLNTDAHLRSVFIGRSECIVIINGKPDLGDFGRVYFVDFDQTRPRDRQVQVQVIGE
jgi:secondary thiamine-phosphate synthase enzyme